MLNFLKNGGDKIISMLWSGQCAKPVPGPEWDLMNVCWESIMWKCACIWVRTWWLVAEGFITCPLSDPLLRASRASHLISKVLQPQAGVLAYVTQLKWGRQTSKHRMATRAAPAACTRPQRVPGIGLELTGASLPGEQEEKGHSKERQPHMQRQQGWGLRLQEGRTRPGVPLG